MNTVRDNQKFIHSGENYGPKFQNRLVLYFRIGLSACSSGFKLRRCYRARKMDRASTTSALTLRHVMNILYKPNWACLFSAQPITARRLFAFHSSVAACALLSHTRCSSGRRHFLLGNICGGEGRLQQWGITPRSPVSLSSRSCVTRL